MGLFSDIFGSDRKKGAQSFGLFTFMNEEQEDREELNNLGLEGWQKEEVKKGNYDPCNFEEEELEDDDYHSEDV